MERTGASDARQLRERLHKETTFTGVHCVSCESDTREDKCLLFWWRRSSKFATHLTRDWQRMKYDVTEVSNGVKDGRFNYAKAKMCNCTSPRGGWKSGEFSYSTVPIENVKFILSSLCQAHHEEGEDTQSRAHTASPPLRLHVCLAAFE